MKNGCIIDNTYKLICKCGEGGGGQVWKAYMNEDIETHVAIKFIKKVDSKKDRIRNEIDFVKECNHKNIIKYIGDGEYNDYYYLVTDYYDRTIEDTLELPISRKFEIILALLDAVKYIHNLGSIHRDIKPDNILYDGEKICLCDFGIVKRKQNNITKNTDMLANREYSAPEQIQKKNADNIKKSADIYSIGKIICYIFTKASLSGSNYELIRYKYPYLYKIDDEIEDMIQYEESKRPTIEIVYSNFSFIFKQISDKLSYYDRKLICSDNLSIEESLRKQISQSIYFGNSLLKNKNLFTANEISCEWESHIRYSVSDSLRALYYYNFVYKVCMQKMVNESVDIAKYNYKNIDYTGSDKKLYNEFKTLLNKYHLDSDYDYLRRKSHKYFISCNSNHATEIVESINNDWHKKQMCIINAPLLEICKNIYDILQTDIDLIDHLKVVKIYEKNKKIENLWLKQNNVIIPSSILKKYGIHYSIKGEVIELNFLSKNEFKNFQKAFKDTNSSPTKCCIIEDFFRKVEVVGDIYKLTLDSAENNIVTEILNKNE